MAWVALFYTFCLLNLVKAEDFLIYAPTSSSQYTSTISSLGKSYKTVTAAQFAAMSTADFQAHGAIVFADPNCQTTISGFLPTTNLANMYAAVTGNVLIIGTDEMFHWGQGGAQMAKSGLGYVIGEAGATGLYVSFSCYYYAASSQPVPFLAPLTTTKGFLTKAAPDCYNKAHIVAKSPALTGLTDASISNWSCSVHEVFHSWPPEFLPLAIAQNIPTSDTVTFGDGTVGIPYILARGKTLAPIKCGDSIVQAGEDCDSGASCTNCKCDAGSVAYSPPQPGCKSTDFCAVYGYSGKPDNAVSCSNGVNSRTITCASGYYAVGASFSATSITLTPGDAPFSGCAVSNFCTVYGYSGRPDNAISCTSTTGGRTITCAPGYYAGGSPADNPVVTLSGSAAFAGCSVIDNCALYGYSGKPTGAKQCINGVNTRTIVCTSGYYAVAPSTASITLTGSAAFGGCSPVDMCSVYGYSGKPSFTASCVAGTNIRTITCKPGYYAMASTDQGPDENNKQRDGAIASITLTGAAEFAGCAEIDKCKFIGCKDTVSGVATTCKQNDGSNSRTCTCAASYYPVGGAATSGSITITGVDAFAGCTPIKACALYGTPTFSTCTDSAPDTRTITCNPGYYAIAPDTPTITLVSTAPFAGCKDIAECTVYGPAVSKAAFISSCEERTINTRTIVCLPGYFAAAPDTPEITLTGSAAFRGGCTEIDECSVYRYSGLPDNTESCTDGINTRTITCKAGYYAVSPSTPSITLTGSAAFTGCKQIDMCAVYGISGKDNVLSCTNSGVNERTVTCKPGYAAVTPSTASVVLKGSAAFGGCTVIDMCAVYGFSGASAHTVNCTNTAVNVRTLLCEEGYSVIGEAGGVPTVSLTGPVKFTGCDEINQCTQYGYSGKPNGTASCTSEVASRTITCLPGYYITGTPMTLPLTTSVKLGHAAVFNGCSEADECVLYGYSSKPNNTKSCKDGINTRTITCNPGWAAALPSNASATLVGAAEFAGCKDIDECAVYGSSGKSDFVLNCSNSAIDERTITCKPGYFAIAPDTASDVLPGSASFVGCTLIDTCAVYRYSGNAEHAISCDSGINNRTITCKEGYYASPPKDLKVTLIGSAEFPGCKVTDMCATNSNGNFTANCTNTGINNRTITCKAGYYAISPATPSILVTGPVDWDGCKDIAECSVYSCADKMNNQTTNCTDSSPIDSRTCTCPTGWVANGTSASVVVTGSAPFAGCSEKCGDGLKIGKEACDDGNVFAGDGCSATCTVETGYTCPTPGSPCETVCGDGNVNGLEQCDDNNLDNFDGCTDTCTIEEGWACKTPGAPCSIIPLCAVLGYDGKPEHTLSCVNGVNTRTITCLPGYYAVAPDSPSVVLVGYVDKFEGCRFPVCGNGIIEGREQCDDGNTDAKDGCNSNCEVEKGYVCTDPGFLCCHDPKTVSADPLECKDGWLVSPTSDPVTLLDTISKQNPLPDLRICGDIELVDQTVTVRGDWSIDGTLTLTRSTLVFSPTVELSHIDLTYDGRCPLKTVMNEKDVQLVIDKDSTIQLNNVVWTDAEKEKLPTVIDTDQGAHMDGQLVVDATEIPDGSSPFDLVVSNTTAYGEPVAGESNVPGACSNIAVEKEDSKIVGYTNRKDLCTGHIVAIAVSAALAALAALLLLLLLLLGSPMSTTTYDYTAL